MRDTVHIPDDLQKRVTELVPAINAQVLVGTANTTAVIRHALALGLTLMERAVADGKPIPQVRDLTAPPPIPSRVVEGGVMHPVLVIPAKEVSADTPVRVAFADTVPVEVLSATGQSLSLTIPEGTTPGIGPSSNWPEISDDGWAPR